MDQAIDERAPVPTNYNVVQMTVLSVYEIEKGRNRINEKVLLE